MTEAVRVEFTDILQIPTLPFSLTVRYFMWAKIQTQDKNGDDVDCATVTVIDGTFEMFVNQVKDVFAYLPDEKNAPMFYARIREAAKAEYMAKRMVWQ